MSEKQQQNQPEKPPVGRPVKRQMPEPIPDTPENIARTLMTKEPPKTMDLSGRGRR